MRKLYRSTKIFLLSHPDFAERLRSIFENKPEFKKMTDPEAQLYDGFWTIVIEFALSRT